VDVPVLVRWRYLLFTLYIGSNLLKNVQHVKFVQRLIPKLADGADDIAATGCSTSVPPHRFASQFGGTLLKGRKLLLAGQVDATPHGLSSAIPL
jgi:hypothetical protein